MESKIISAYQNGLKRLFSIYNESEFTFIVGDQKVKCSKNLACLISPRVMHLLKNDPTSEELILLPNKSKNSSNVASTVVEETSNDHDNLLKDLKYFLNFYSSGYNNNEIDSFLDDSVGSKEIKKDTLSNPIGLEIMFKLQNFDLFFAETVEETNIYNLINELSRIEKFHQMIDQNIIDFIASNIYKIDLEILKQIDIKLLYQLITSKCLKLNDEHSLFIVIYELYEQKLKEEINEVSLNDYIHLFDAIEFPNLSDNDITSFLSIFNYNHLNSMIWNSLCCRLTNSFNQNTTRYTGHSIFQEKIIQYLKHNHSKSINELIHVQCSSTNKIFHDGKDCFVVLDDDLNCWYSRNASFGWISFHFYEGILIHPTSYSIKYGEGTNGFIQKWYFEGSSDNNKWDILEDHMDTDIENAEFSEKQYGLSTINWYNSFRIRIGDSCWGDNYYLGFCKLEISGDMKKQ
ncbi:hypothetical protein TRFO_23137 [Tritrichomonas foetus]|uniref:F5/8 type C domain-containing protein n=1 Tax=Tritrichomonas foetus TaxID=1144522 RepID=A0A1J4KBN2_9EUKA|nr:hypothetical protein TRFO_23137 [Tritrichomonas foetus]|eukprot:OHT08378.1 hypothetical protein TRFO_23137 [Tritrichomonas foetus]